LLGAVGEEIVCVEKLVAPVFVSIAVKLIGSALCRHDHRSTGTPAILRRIRIGDHLEFLNGVHGWAGRLCTQLLDIFRKRVVVNSIENEIVLQRVHAVNVKRPGAAGACDCWAAAGADCVCVPGAAAGAELAWLKIFDIDC